jgi:hypothetical protein
MPDVQPEFPELPGPGSAGGAGECMKIGFNLLLYTGHVTEANYPVIEKLKKPPATTASSCPFSM